MSPMSTTFDTFRQLSGWWKSDMYKTIPKHIFTATHIPRANG